MSAIRENWRIVMLAAFLVASGVAIFAPMAGGAGSTVTNTVPLSENTDHTVTVTDSTLLTDGSNVTVTNGSGSVAIDDGIVRIEGEQTSVEQTDVSVSNGTINVTGGTVQVPTGGGVSVSDPSDPENATIDIASSTLDISNSSVQVGVGQTKWTNLVYGLDLEGGTRLRAPLVGMTAEGVALQPSQGDAVADSLAEDLGVDAIDVNVVQQSNNTAAIEIYSENVTDSQFQSALEGLDLYGEDIEIRDGVTDQTRETVINTLQEKVNRGGLTGGRVTSLEGDGQTFIVVEVPGATRSEVVNLVGERGVVQVIAQVRTGNGTTVNQTVLTGEDFASIGNVGQRDDGSWGVSVTVEDDAAPDFAASLRQLGFTSGSGPSNCDYERQMPSPGSYCLLTVLNGNVVQSNSLSPSLARDIDSGSWENDPGFSIGARNISEAQNLKVSIQVGALPTNMDIDDRGTSAFISPSLAQDFKVFALITGLIAWLGVSAMVFFRYQRIRVAVPMLFTAIAEVFILLAFASIVGLRLDLSHIAGFIAVIGTGVDDLIIMADEILQQGNVATGRVFQSRFRKAFWVIGAAAATTIIAMSPLAVLSLGDLQGFAIVTIVGVLIGVLITRPAYGDILRNLVLNEDHEA